jgi:hypothetical protein
MGEAGYGRLSSPRVWRRVEAIRAGPQTYGTRLGSRAADLPPELNME